MMMGFDPATLLTVSATALIMFALAMLAMGDTARTDRRWWVAAFLLGAIGFTLMIAAPDKALALPRDLANILFLLAYGSAYAGARRLAGRRPLLLLVATGALLWLILVGGAQISVALRMPIASLLISGYAILIAGELAGGARPEERARRAAAWLCLLHAGFYAARALWGPTLGFTADSPESALSIWAAMLAFETILFSAGLSTLIVAAMRDRQALVDRKLALTDNLTGIGNRHAFEIQGRPLVEEARAGEPRPMLLLMDVDGFKAVNDAVGHAAGDRLLVDVAAAARACLSEPDLIWRIGGDEFAALLRGPDAVHARTVAGAIRAAVKNRARRLDRPELAASVTIGLAPARSGATLAQLLDEADAALYAGKRRGRDCAVIAGMEEQAADGSPRRGEIQAIRR
ncbi:MAG TPA: GGDEF domain-containing protein [Sphingomonas sp.]|nr:GGDEF domain-containing protein [Sphingomonas sp.]